MIQIRIEINKSVNTVGANPRTGADKDEEKHLHPRMERDLQFPRRRNLPRPPLSSSLVLSSLELSDTKVYEP